MIHTKEELSYMCYLFFLIKRAYLKENYYTKKHADYLDINNLDINNLDSLFIKTEIIIPTTIIVK